MSDKKSISKVGGLWTDRSGTITLGGTAQTIMDELTSRHYLLIQNTSDTAMWFNIGVVAVASQPSLYLAAGDSFECNGSFIPNGFVSVIGATTGKIFTAKEA